MSVLLGTRRYYNTFCFLIVISTQSTYSTFVGPCLPVFAGIPQPSPSDSEAKGSAWPSKAMDRWTRRARMLFRSCSSRVPFVDGCGPRPVPSRSVVGGRRGGFPCKWPSRGNALAVDWRLIHIQAVTNRPQSIAEHPGAEV